MNRLFIALDLPDDTLDDIISIRDLIYSNGIIPRWEKREKLHITLKFLGSVTKEKTSEIINVINKHISDVKFCSAEYKNFGLFTGYKGNSILWMGFQIDKTLFQFIKNLENDLEKIGFKKEKRSFKPHLTLLRIKDKDNFDKIDEFRNYELNKCRFTFPSISLIKSELKSSGSEYTKIKCFELT